MQDAEPWSPDLKATFAASGPTLSSEATGERRLAAISYMFMWVTGLIVLAAADRSNRFARWHAIQAVGFGLAASILAVLLNVLSLAALHAAAPFVATQEAPWYAIALLVGFMALGFVAVFAWEAYHGRTLRIPAIAQIADRLA